MKNFYFLLFICFTSYSQVGINTSNPSPASVLDIESSNDGVNFGGFMPPRVNATGKANITSKATASDDGLMIYFEDTRCLQIWNGVELQWENVFCMPAITPPASNLFISEYVEGSGNNKVVEVANFTGSAINLSNYEINGYQNGAMSPNYTYTFPTTTLLDGDVYVIAHPSYSGPIGNIDEYYNWQFNGDDVVELVDSSNTPIDIIGTIGSTTNFAQNLTLRKKPGIGPSTIYNGSDYDSYPQNDFSGLGNHSF